MSTRPQLMTPNRLPELGSVEEIRTMIQAARVAGLFEPRPPEPPKPKGPRSTARLLCRTDDADQMPDALRRSITQAFPNTYHK